MALFLIWCKRVGVIWQVTDVSWKRLQIALWCLYSSARADADADAAVLAYT
jgi:hypothetical protein